MNFEEYCASVGVTPALKDKELSPTSVALRDRLAIKLIAVEHIMLCANCHREVEAGMLEVPNGS